MPLAYDDSYVDVRCDDNTDQMQFTGIKRIPTMKTPLNPLTHDRVQEVLNAGKPDQVRSRVACKHKFRSKWRNITILGDSLLKNIEQYRMNINSLEGDNPKSLLNLYQRS